MAIAPRNYLWLGNFLVLGLVVWSGVSLGLSVLGRHIEVQIGAQGPIEAGQRRTTRMRTLAQYESMANYNIFGAQPQEAPSKAKVSESSAIKPAKADYSLKGIIYDERSSNSAAIIEDLKTKKQDVYRVGAMIGSIEVVAIDPESVTLKQDGQESQLKLIQLEGKGRPSDQPVYKEPTRSSGLEEAAIAKSVGPNRYVVSRDTLNQYMGDLNAFMSSVQVKPFIKEGQAYGFQVSYIRPNSPAANLGIKVGDIVLKVNDISVGKPEDLVNLYRQVQQLESVAVEIDRGGKTETLNYSLR